MSKSISYRQAFAVGLSVLVAVIATYYFSLSQTYWICLLAFFVNQTTLGTPLRQGVIAFIAVIFAIFIATILTMQIKERYVIDILLAIIFFVTAYLSYLYPTSRHTFFSAWVFFPLMVLIATLSQDHGPSFLRDAIIDASMGAAMGIIIGKIFFPIRLDKEFGKGVIPLLHTLISYSQTLTTSFTNQTNSYPIREKKYQIEKILKAQESLYPEWIYEVGFNPGLRSGYRFFLVNLEKITELFFSLNYLMVHATPLLSLNKLSECFTITMQKNEELLTALITYFDNKKIQDSASDFTSDIKTLEKEVQHVIPAHLELLDISAEYVSLTALVRTLRDVRELALQLVMALPGK